MILFRNSISVFLINSANPDSWIAQFSKFVVFKQTPFFNSRSKFLYCFTEYARWSSLLVSPLSFVILFLKSIAEFWINAASSDSKLNDFKPLTLFCGVASSICNFFRIMYLSFLTFCCWTICYSLLSFCFINHIEVLSFWMIVFFF